MNAADREMLDLFVQESAENLEAFEGDFKKPAKPVPR